jgi:hypothetical protein
MIDNPCRHRAYDHGVDPGRKVPHWHHMDSRTRDPSWCTCETVRMRNFAIMEGGSLWQHTFHREVGHYSRIFGFLYLLTGSFMIAPCQNKKNSSLVSRNFLSTLETMQILALLRTIQMRQKHGVVILPSALASLPCPCLFLPMPQN